MTNLSKSKNHKFSSHISHFDALITTRKLTQFFTYWGFLSNVFTHSDLESAADGIIDAIDHYHFE